MLDVFAYLGAWGLAAARAGAREVLCVDSSAAALTLLQESAAANDLGAVRTLRDDAFDALAALRAAGEKFDLVIVDPPAFIKRKRDLPKGIAAYRKLNQMAMQLLSRDGILVTCSCSHHLPQDELIAAVQQSARHLSRFAQVDRGGRPRARSPDPPRHPRDALSQDADLPGRARLTGAPCDGPVRSSCQEPACRHGQLCDASSAIPIAPKSSRSRPVADRPHPVR